MVLHRFYCENLQSSAVELVGGESRHAAMALRLGVGEVVELFDGLGCVAAAEIVEVGKKKVVLQIRSRQNFKRPDDGVIIATSIAKNDRFDWLIGKCTELGVDRIVPVVFERTVKLPKNPRILERWQKITIESAKQCKRAFLPVIDKPMKLEQALEVLVGEYPDGVMMMGSTDGEGVVVSDVDSGGKDVIAFVGPEGGFTDEEVELMKGSNVRAVKLTKTILRIETAAVAFASVLAVERDKN